MIEEEGIRSVASVKPANRKLVKKCPLAVRTTASQSNETQILCCFCFSSFPIPSSFRLRARGQHHKFSAGLNGHSGRVVPCSFCAHHGYFLRQDLCGALDASTGARNTADSTKPDH